MGSCDHAVAGSPRAMVLREDRPYWRITMPIDDQLKMQILLGELDPDGKGGYRFPRRRSAARGGFAIAASVGLVILFAIIAAL